MQKRLYFATAFALALAGAPGIGAAQTPATQTPAAQTPARITVAYYDAPLRGVIQNFAAFAKRTIVIATDIGDSRVNMELQNVDWWSGLNVILAQHGLVARELASGVINVEKRQPIPPPPPGR